jgi:hypothetical protein
MTIDSKNLTDSKIKGELSSAKVRAIKRVDQLSGDSEWSILQQIIHDIESFFLIKEDKKVTLDKILDNLEDEIKLRYSSDDEVHTEIREALIAAIPSKNTLSKWRAKKGWIEAVWARVRSGPTGLFSLDKRANVIHSMYDSATKGNVNAAKIWLTLSGDYSEKAEAKNEVVDQYREINKIIHSK